MHLPRDGVSNAIGRFRVCYSAAVCQPLRNAVERCTRNAKYDRKPTRLA